MGKKIRDWSGIKKVLLNPEKCKNALNQLQGWFEKNNLSDNYARVTGYEGGDFSFYSASTNRYEYYNKVDMVKSILDCTG